MAEPVVVRAIVAGHGSFAAGVLSAVDQITGMGASLVPITNSDLCADDIVSAISKALDDTGARVVFTDLPAGSCTMAVRRLLRARSDVLLVTGANVPMLIDFVMQDDVDAVEAAKASVNRARDAITLHGRTP